MRAPVAGITPSWLTGRFGSAVPVGSPGTDRIDLGFGLSQRDCLAMMGSPEPLAPSPDLGEGDAVIVTRGDGRPVGLATVAPSNIADDIGMVALCRFDARTSGAPDGDESRFCFVEGALRYCAWLLSDRYRLLMAEVLSENDRMRRILQALTPAPALRSPAARHFAGRWHDLETFLITPNDVTAIAETWFPKFGFAWPQLVDD